MVNSGIIKKHDCFSVGILFWNIFQKPEEYMMTKKLYLGKSHYINNGIDMSDEYLNISKNDEKAAELLYLQSLYNQAVYFYIQSMEKYIKSAICRKIDVTNDYYADKLHMIGHSLDDAIDFFIEIVSGNNEMLKMQITEQLKKGVLKGVRFSAIYNAVRYPFYKNYNYKFTTLQVFIEKNAV